MNKELIENLSNGEKNDFLGKYCPKLLEKIEGMISHCGSIEPKYQYRWIRSSRININDFSTIKDQIGKAENFIVEVCWALKNLGLDIKIKRLFWHNVMDSCENITGNIGCFILEFEFEKAGMHADFKTDFELRMKENEAFMKEQNSKLYEMWEKYFDSKKGNK